MLTFLGPFLTAAIAFVEEHPDLTKALLANVASVLGAHAAHPAPASPEAVAAMQAGIAAAASSAVTSALARKLAVAATVKT